MARDNKVTATTQDVRRLENEILKQSEKLGDLIVRYRFILGATGIPMPKPPRPMIGVIGSLTYFGLLLGGAFRIPRRWPK